MARKERLVIYPTVLSEFYKANFTTCVAYVKANFTTSAEKGKPHSM